MSLANIFDRSVLGTDMCFDDWLRISRTAHPAIDTDLIPQIRNFEQRKRERTQRGDFAFGAIVSTVVANALRAIAVSRSRNVYYSRKRQTYSAFGKGLYYPGYLGSKGLCKIIDLMAKGGWIQNEIGRFNKDTGEGRRSTFQATNKLVSYCSGLGIDTKFNSDRSGAPLVKLRGKDRKFILYERSSHKEVIEPLRLYNDFLEQVRLGLGAAEDERTGLTLKVSDGGEVRCHEERLLDLSAKSLYRVFNNGDWQQGGRFYGGWWQIVPSSWRESIAIDGEKTVELDYSGFLTRAIYHAEGIDFRGDPYDIPEIREAASKKNMEWETVRDSIKLATNILINAEPETGLRLIPGLRFPKPLTKTKAFELIATHHSRIEHRFRCGQGLRIMYRESRICQEILTNGRLTQIPVLPIHDSFIVQDRHKSWLRDQMASCYRNEFGYQPVIKDKTKEMNKKVFSQRATSVREGLLPLHSSYGETARPNIDPYAHDTKSSSTPITFQNDEIAALRL
jgi:hypothetical protein